MMTLDTFEDRGNFVRDRLWYSSDLVLNKKKDNERFEKLVGDVLSQLPLDDLNLDRLCVEAADLMRADGAEERDVALFLALLERAISLLRVIEEERHGIAELLEHEAEMQEGIEDPEEYDPDYIAHVKRQAETLRYGARKQMIEILREYDSGPIGAAEAVKSRFDGELVRTLIDQEKGNRRFTDTLRNQLAELLGVSPQAVTSMKAWHSGELNGRAAKLDDMIDKSRSKLKPRKEKKPQQAKKNEAITAEHTETTEEQPESVGSIDEVYSILDQRYLGLAQSLQPADLSYDQKNGFTREQRKWIYALIIFCNGNESKKKSLRSILSKGIFGCSVQKVSAVTAHLSGKLIAKAEEKGEESEVWQDLQDVMKLEKELEESKDSAKTGGEHFEYDNEAKNEWRRKLSEFIESTTDPEKRKEMKVLCLPGIECHEIGVYTDLGFEPGNIFAIEGGDEAARATFEENAKKLGVSYRIGRLEDGVVDTDGPFDVVSLDFLGAMCPTYVKILSRVPYSKSAILCVNTMAKRDSFGSSYEPLKKDLIEGSSGIPVNTDELKGQAIQHIQEDRPFTTEAILNNEAFGAMFSEMKSKLADVFTPINEGTVAGSRDLALFELYISCFANRQASRHSKMAGHMFEEMNAAENDHPFLEMARQRMTGYMDKMKVTSVATIITGIFTDLDEDAPEHINNLARRALLNKPAVTSWGQYEYQSGSSPFVTHFMRLESITELIEENINIADFIVYSAAGLNPNSFKGKSIQKMKEAKDEMDKVKKGRNPAAQRKITAMLLRKFGIKINRGGTSVSVPSGPFTMEIGINGLALKYRDRHGEYVIKRADVEKAVRSSREFESNDMLPDLIEKVSEQASYKADSKKTSKKARGLSEVLKSFLVKMYTQDPDATKEIAEIEQAMTRLMFNDQFMKRMLDHIQAHGGKPDDETMMEFMVEQVEPDQRDVFREIMRLGTKLEKDWV